MGTQPRGLQVQQGGGDEQELAGLVQVPPVAHGPQVSDELVGDSCRATSATSSLCLLMSWSSRSNGPVKLANWTVNPVDSPARAAAGRAAAGHAGRRHRPRRPRGRRAAGRRAARSPDDRSPRPGHRGRQGRPGRKYRKVPRGKSPRARKGHPGGARRPPGLSAPAGTRARPDHGLTPACGGDHLAGELPVVAGARRTPGRGW